MSLDQLAQAPKVERRQTPEKVQNGTVVKVRLGHLPSILEEYEKARFLLFGWKYAALNPHLTLSFEAFGESHAWERTAGECPKWTAAEPDPPHWYDIEAFERLVGACVAKDRDQGTDRPLRDFLRGFAGLRGSAKLKAVTDQTELTRCNLSALINCDGLDRSKTARLLEAMHQHGREPKPTKLGAIGREHIQAVFGTEVFGEIRYKKVVGTSGGLPFVVEAAFGERINSEADIRCITGCNFSPAVDRPCVRRLDSLLEHQMIDEDSPVVVMLHVATPAPTYLDRGKSIIDVTGDLSEAIDRCVVYVTSEWRKQRKLEERDARQALRQREERLRQRQRPKMQLNNAVVKVLPEAIEKASGGGVCEFSQRDFYYAARQLIQQFTEKELVQKYFDRIVDEYEKANGLIEGRLRDPRGYLLEPHTGQEDPAGHEGRGRIRDPALSVRHDSLLREEGHGIEMRLGTDPRALRLRHHGLRRVRGPRCQGVTASCTTSAQDESLLLPRCRSSRLQHRADTDVRRPGAHNYFVEVIDAGLAPARGS